MEQIVMTRVRLLWLLYGVPWIFVAESAVGGVLAAAAAAMLVMAVLLYAVRSIDVVVVVAVVVVAYDDADENGASVLEAGNDNKAKEEIRELVSEFLGG